MNNKTHDDKNRKLVVMFWNTIIGTICIAVFGIAILNIGNAISYLMGLMTGLIVMGVFMIITANLIQKREQNSNDK